MQIESVIKRSGAVRPFSVVQLERSLARAMLHDEQGELLVPERSQLGANEQNVVRTILAALLPVLQGDDQGRLHAQALLTALFRATLAAGEVDAAWRMTRYRQWRGQRGLNIATDIAFAACACGSAAPVEELQSTCTFRDRMMHVSIDAGFETYATSTV